MGFRGWLRQQWLNLVCWLRDLFNLRPVCVMVDVNNLFLADPVLTPEHHPLKVISYLGDYKAYFSQLAVYLSRLHRRGRLAAVLIAGRPMSHLAVSAAEQAFQELKRLIPEVFVDDEENQVGVALVEESSGLVEALYSSLMKIVLLHDPTSATILPLVMWGLVVRSSSFTIPIVMVTDPHYMQRPVSLVAQICQACPELSHLRIRDTIKIVSLPGRSGDVRDGKSPSRAELNQELDSARTYWGQWLQQHFPLQLDGAGQESA